MDQKKPSNTAKGRHSQDAQVGGDLVAFVNRSATPYPTEVGGARFEPIPVERQKDIMVNVARMHPVISIVQLRLPDAYRHGL